MACLCGPIGNDKELKELFDSWCSVSGYVNRLTEYKEAYFENGHSEEIKAIKNLYGCEAHNEVIKNALMMIYESRIEDARQGIEKIRKLQNMEY